MKNFARKRAMLEKIMEEVNNCERCEVGRKENQEMRCKLPFDLARADSKIMFIGICPGVSWRKKQRERPRENEKPLPVRRPDFIKLLERVGIEEKSFYGTNIVKCACTGSDRKNRNPIVKEILNCNCFLQQEIDVVKPELIVTMGRIPREYFEITEFSSRPRKDDKLNCEIFPARHYSNQRGARDKFLKQMRELGNIIKKAKY